MRDVRTCLAFPMNKAEHRCSVRWLSMDQCPHPMLMPVTDSVRGAHIHRHRLIPSAMEVADHDSAAPWMRLL